MKKNINDVHTPMYSIYYQRRAALRTRRLLPSICSYIKYLRIYELAHRVIQVVINRQYMSRITYLHV